MTKPGQGSRKARRARRAFSPEYKPEAVRLVQERRRAGASLAQVARELDVRAELLRQWMQHVEPAGSDRVGETAQQELQRLRRENAVLRQEQASQKTRPWRFAPSGRVKLLALPSSDRVAWPSTLLVRRIEPVKKHGPGASADRRVVTPAAGW